MKMFLILINKKLYQIKITAGQNPNQTTGRLCLWSQKDENDDPDRYANFFEYRKTLNLKCSSTSQSALLQFTPTDKTPDILFYQVSILWLIK